VPEETESIFMLPSKLPDTLAHFPDTRAGLRLNLYLDPSTTLATERILASQDEDHWTRERKNA
jgi:hypothetical protein